MGTTSQKLTYLNETKQQIKEKINNLGGSITSETTFRSYANQLQDVYDNYPKTSYGEGTSVTLENCNKGKLDFDKLEGQTSQDGEPTPTNPITINSVTGNQEVVVSGKNLCDLSQVEIGKAWNNASNSARAVVYMNLKPNTTYTISATGYSAFDSSMFYWFEKASKEADTRTAGGFDLNSSTLPRTITTNSNSGAFLLQFNKTGISTSDFTNVKIQVQEGSSATTYEPYITPITKTLALGDRKIYEGDYLWIDTSTGKKYHHHKFSDITFTGASSESWDRSNTNVTGEYRFTNSSISSLVKKPADNNTPVSALCNRLLPETSNHTFTQTQGFSVNASGVLNLFIASLKSESVANFKTWVASNNLNFVYQLNTETDEEITGTLAEQMQEIWDMMSITGTTIIETEGNLPIIVKVRSLKGE